MATGKDDSEDELGSKGGAPNAALAAKLQALFDDEFALQDAPLELLTIVKKSLHDVEAFTARADAIGAEARAAGLVPLAEVAKGTADRLRRVNSAEFHAGALRLVQLVYMALGTGSTAHVIWASERLEERRRREWLNVCRNELHFWLQPSALVDLEREQRSHAVELLPRLLAWVEPKARALTPEVVGRILDGRAETLEAVAGNLACECGAFGYGRGDRKKAKDAFSKLDREE